MNRLIVYLILLSVSTLAQAATLKLLWKNTDVASNRQWGEINYPSWQGVGINGKYYIQNAAKEVIEVWDETGIIEEIPSGKGTNITKDTAGNLIVRYCSYLKPLLLQNQVLIINPKNGSKQLVNDISFLGDKCYLFGQAAGNMIDGSGSMFCLAQGTTLINIVAIKDGKYLIDESKNYDFGQIIHPDIDIYYKRGLKSVNTNAIVIPEINENKTILSISNPYFDLTSYSADNSNSIYRVSVQGDELKREGFYRTPYHNGCAGFDITSYNDTVNYIVYPSGINNADGFSIAKIESFAPIPKNNTDDNKHLLLTKDEESLNGESLYKNIDNEIRINNLNFEVKGEKIYIYQYVPCAYVAMYEFNPNEVDDGISKPIYNSRITVSGNYVNIPSDVKYSIYDISGRLIPTTGSGRERLSVGLYIVKTNNSIQKIIIH